MAYLCLTRCHREQLENPLPKGLFARMSGTSSASWSLSSQAVSRSPGPVRVADIPTAWWSQGGCISYTAASFQEAGGGKSQTIQGLSQELAFGSFPPCPTDPRLFYAAVTRPPNLSCLIPLKFISDSCEKVYCGYSHLPGELFSVGWFIFQGALVLRHLYINMCFQDHCRTRRQSLRAPVQKRNVSLSLTLHGPEKVKWPNLISNGQRSTILPARKTGEPGILGSSGDVTLFLQRVK